MSYRDTVLYVAFEELEKPVHWAVHGARILDYFRVSTGVQYTKAQALEVSWCTYFVHWCLVQGGMQPLPAVGTAATLGKMGSTGRFMRNKGGVYETVPVTNKQFRPRPGDMYYKPTPNNHIGFIAEVRAGSRGSYEIKSIDGNSGPAGFSPLFDMSHGRKIGYGFIYQPADWRQLANECWYIQLVNED